jgi:signal transduction histidine kinase
MNISQRFLILFCAVVLAACFLTSGIAIHSLHEAYVTFTHATKPELIPLMAGKMYFKAVIAFCVASCISIAIALPAGIYLFRQTSKPYLYIFEHLSDIAQKRLHLHDEKRLSDSVITSIQRFLELWRFDYEKLRDYEKEKEWKNGARMLIHEIKNPLTPLKLSTQKLQLQNNDQIQNELQTIVKATADIENILTCFKELVNIEFNPKEMFDSIEYIRELNLLAKEEYPAVTISGEPQTGVFPVIAEKSLLKIVYFNLFHNGIEANPSNFRIEVAQLEKAIILEFITSDRTIENTSRIFRLGYSTKGPGRGFGLFICKKISEYLDLDLKCSNRGSDVVFSLRLNGAALNLIDSDVEPLIKKNTGSV